MSLFIHFFFSRLKMTLGFSWFHFFIIFIIFIFTSFQIHKLTLLFFFFFSIISLFLISNSLNNQFQTSPLFPFALLSQAKCQTRNPSLLKYAYPPRYLNTSLYPPQFPVSLIANTPPRKFLNTPPPTTFGSSLTAKYTTSLNGKISTLAERKF